MRLPDRILSCVGFISHDQAEIRYGGTVFVVGIDGSNDNVFLHFVTAAHVAEKVEGGPWIIGMNGKDGGRILLRSGNAPWWYHPTEKSSVDVAVTLFASGILEEYDLEWIPEVMFATDKNIKHYDIGIGDEINAIGLFTRFHGSKRHWPIVRTGNIAMMPTDKIPVKGFGEIDAYLAEGRSIGGLSGSPVFVRNTVNMPVMTAKREPEIISGLGPLHFLGLMHGHWETPIGFNSAEQVEAVNMGISIVVPAKKILEVLYHPELVAMRKKYDDAIKDEKAPVADTVLTKEQSQTFTQHDFETALKKASRRVESPQK